MIELSPLSLAYYSFSTCLFFLPKSQLLSMVDYHKMVTVDDNNCMSTAYHKMVTSEWTADFLLPITRW